MEYLEPDEFGNILDLPLSEEEEAKVNSLATARQECMDLLTQLLVDVEEGNVIGFCLFAEAPDGSIAWWQRPHDGGEAMSVRMIRCGLANMGLVTSRQLEAAIDNLRDG